MFTRYVLDILSKLEGAEYFSIMDLQLVYPQLPLRKEDREKQPSLQRTDYITSRWSLFLPAIYGYHIGRSSMVFMFSIFG
jgi:hypothetical protein